MPGPKYPQSRPDKSSPFQLALFSTVSPSFCFIENLLGSCHSTQQECQKTFGIIPGLGLPKMRHEIFGNLPSQKTLRIRWLVRPLLGVGTSIWKPRYRTPFHSSFPPSFPPHTFPTNHHHSRNFRHFRLIFYNFNGQNQGMFLSSSNHGEIIQKCLQLCSSSSSPANRPQVYRR